VWSYSLLKGSLCIRFVLFSWVRLGRTALLDFVDGDDRWWEWIRMLEGMLIAVRVVVKPFGHPLCLCFESWL
jgi:hypothetical protein